MKTFSHVFRSWKCRKMYTLRNILNFVFITQNEKVWLEMVYQGSHSPCPLQHLLPFVFFKLATLTRVR